MALTDWFRSKEDLIQELAGLEVAQSPLTGQIDAEELKECAELYINESFSKEQIIQHLSTVRKSG